jgi:hypothetical protein
LTGCNHINKFRKERYKQAIHGDQKFEEVKMIYLKIKDLEHKADELMQLANCKLENKNQ